MVGIIPEGVGDSHPNGGRIGNFTGGGGGYWVVETCGEVILTIQTFSKAKNNFL